VRRATVDTNIWVSAVLNPHGAPRQLYLAAVSQAFVVVASEPLLSELADVLARPRLVRRHGQPPEAIAAFLGDLRAGAELVEIPGEE
jgi:putative PIN family toxin of toxin-antitoxin system